MRNYKEITLRYLKGQKNRSILTILGIILSVALITAIGTMIVSARGALINQAIREEGSYHGMIMDADEDTANKLKNHVEVEDVGSISLIGSAPIVETTEEERVDYGRDLPYRFIEINSFDKDSFKLLPKELKEGRLPESPDEIIIEYWMLDYFDEDIEIGDKINLTIGQGHESFQATIDQEYTLVGLIQPRYIWRGDLISQGIIGPGAEITNGIYELLFTLKEVKGAQRKISSIVDDLGIQEGNYLTNYRLLRLSTEHFNENFNNSIKALLAFVVAIIMISSVAVIYNSFNISVLERVSQFGLLRSIGASPNQIKGIVLREAGLLSIIGIPIGLFAGVFSMRVVLFIISLIASDMYLFKDMEIIMSVPVFIISSILGLITVFLSAIGPTRRAGKVSPLEAIRNTEDIKVSKNKKPKKAFLIKKLFGIEGQIAYKNLSRNRKRFIITVFSMVISIALFITFSSFSDLLFNMDAVDTDIVSDYQIYGAVKNLGYDELYSRLIEVEGLDRIYTLKRVNGQLLLEDSQINDTIKDIGSYMFTEKEGDFTRVPNVQVSIIGDRNLNELNTRLIEGKIDVDEMNEQMGVLVVNNTFIYGDGSNSGLYQGYNIEVGDTIPFGSYEFEDDPQYMDLRVMGILEKNIIGEEYNYNGSVNIITTEEVFNKIYYQDGLESNRFPGTHIEIIMDRDGDRQEMSSLLDELQGLGLHYIDRAAQTQENRNATIIISIFLYGFVTIIAIISGINIINTISTNILLRTREIAMIKAVGMSQSSLKKMIAYEGVFYGIYASIIGGALGLGSSYIIFRILMGISKFEYRLPWQNVAIGIIGAMTITILAGIYPLRRINKKIIVESMKAEN